MTVSDVTTAQDVFSNHWPVSRTVVSKSLSTTTGKHIYLKLETELPTGSFKPRGALFALSERLRQETIREVVTFSTGNHGLAVAYAASLMGVSATVVVPRHCNSVKKEKILGFGAHLVQHGRDTDEASLLARQHAKDNGSFLLDDITNANVVVGTATIASEILAQVKDVDTVVVPVGDSALARGIGEYLRLVAPHVKLIGVQPSNQPTYYDALRGAKRTDVRRLKTIADGLATRTAEPRNVERLRTVIADMLLVSEIELLRGVRHLLLEEHLLSEPSGAAAAAAVLSSPSLGGKTIVLVITGCNVTENIVRRAVNGRLCLES